MNDKELTEIDSQVQGRIPKERQNVESNKRNLKQEVKEGREERVLDLVQRIESRPLKVLTIVEEGRIQARSR